MTAPRTQQHRYWVQVEYQPAEGNRRLYHIDLNMVDGMMVVLGPNPDNPEDKDFAIGVKFHYAGTMQPITIENWAGFKSKAANELYQAWKQFAEIQIVSEPAILGVLHMPQGTGKLYK